MNWNFYNELLNIYDEFQIIVDICSDEIQINVEKKLEWPEKIYSTSELNSNYTSSCFLKGVHHAERNRSLYSN